MRWLLRLWDRLLHHDNGYKISPPDDRDYKYEDKFKVGASTGKVDLRSSYKDVRNQLTTQACTAFAVGASIEYLLSKYYGGMYRDVSVAYNWYYSRLKHGWEKENSGAYLRDALKEMYSKGFVFERNMPFSVRCYLDVPDDNDKLLGQTTKSLFLPKTAYYTVTHGSVKDSLNNDAPVIFSIVLDDCYYGNRTGIITYNKITKYAHAMVVVGYDDYEGVYIVRNSWGKGWGDKGYCYIKYEDFNQYSYDLWAIREK